MSYSLNIPFLHKISLRNVYPFLFSFLSHSDPENFAEPEKFNPDRFEDPEVRNHPAYLPFGNGPRSCVGTRFALVQVRTALAYLVKHFRFSVSPNHKPIQFASAGLLHATNGLLFNVECRE